MLVGAGGLLSAARARLAGKTAIVTGAARGSGAEIAQRSADEAAQVVVADVRDDLGAAVAEKIAGRYVRVDVTGESAGADLLVDGGMSAGMLIPGTTRNLTVKTSRGARPGTALACA